MKKLARLLCAILSVALCVGCFSMVGCNPTKSDGSNNEKSAIIFSVQELDNVFNPYFATSGYDTEITGMTQISLLASDADGNVYCGDDEPSAALDYSQIISYDDGTGMKTYNVDDKDPAKRAPSVSSDALESVSPDDYYTTYQFLLKNGIRFSDGQPLTIKDVIFNLYALLDPAYYGSATVYSTAIQGLAKYRTQDPTAVNGGDDEAAKSRELTAQAMERMNNFRLAYYEETETRDRIRSKTTDAEKAQMIKDAEEARFLFYDEVMADWKAAKSELESYEEENEKAKTDANVAAAAKGFTEAWEIFLYNYGIITVEETTDPVTHFTKIKTYDDEEDAANAFDKYGNPHKVGDKMINYGETWKWFHDEDKNYLPLIIFNNYVGIGPYQIGGTDSSNNICQYEKDGTGVKKIEGAKAPTCDIIEDDQGYAFNSSYKSDTAKYEEELWNGKTMLGGLYTVLTSTLTMSKLIDQFTGEALSASTSDNSELKVDRIEGIKIIQLNEGDTFTGKNGTTQIDETSYVLQVRVDRVDPKALANCGVTVAPMHYYSNVSNVAEDRLTDAQRASFAASDWDDFNYPVYDKDGKEIEVAGIYSKNKKVCPGIKYMSREYFDEVIKNPKIISVPVGAGMYQVSSETEDNPYYLFQLSNELDEYGIAKPDLGSDGQPILKGGLEGSFTNRKKFTDFDVDNSMIYFIRNPFFFTTSGNIVGADHFAQRDYTKNKINNCKIKNVRYKITTSNKLLDSIIMGEVHYGDPASNDRNDAKIQTNKKLSSIEVKNNGYGYIGINAAYVPDLVVRRAIMTALDTSLVKAYYGRSAEIITRSMSTCSWASPDNINNPAREKVLSGNGKYTDDYYPYIKDETTLKNQIRSMIENSGKGYKLNGKVYERKLADGTTHKLKYTFTIAGSTDDHPAYSTMQNAANILNDCGFDVKVKTDAQALSKLSAGLLTVWAAAWSSGSDPDMYQVYHMDSKATSVNNWGYPTILAKKGADYNDQYEIIQDLSDLIDKGRETLDQKSRAETYLDALNKIMELAVEYPTYQRTNNYVYRNDIINGDTLIGVGEATPFYGPLARMWNVELL